MKPGRFKSFIKQVVIIAMAMVVLAGASGLSYTTHYCHGKLSGTAFYPELGLQKPASCGCEDQASDTHHSSKIAGLGSESCCSNILVYSKLNIESLTNTYSSPIHIQPAVIETIPVLVPAKTEALFEAPATDFTFRPPSLSGRDLVLFLSQQRIPYSS